MTSLARRNWFLIALATVIAVGATQHASLAPITEAAPRDILVAAVLLLMGLRIDLGSSLRTGSAWTATAVAVAVNAVLAPPAAWLFGRLLVDDLATGLVIAAAAPCTIASAAIWTRRGGGNEGVALAVTAVTNLACFVTLPLATGLLLGELGRVDGSRLAWKLALIVAAPLVASQPLRRSATVRRGCDRLGTLLAMAAQLGLLTLVLIASVRGGGALADPSITIPASGWGALLAAVVATHVGLFAAGWRLARLAGAEPRDALAAAVGGSQKTLAVGLSVAMAFGPLAVAPMIVYHALQLLIDTLLVQTLARRIDRPERGRNAG